MFGFLEPLRVKLEKLIRVDSEKRLSQKGFVVQELIDFTRSMKRKQMIDGERYYNGNHDILARQRTVIGANGKLETVDNLPNNRVVDNQYRKVVTQKANYLVGKPLTVRSTNDDYQECLQVCFNRKFMRQLKGVATDSLNGGVGWLYAHYDDDGELVFTRFRPWEILPFWKDQEHTELECAIRIYEVVGYYSVGNAKRVIRKVEVYAKDGISYYELTDGGSLVPEGDGEKVPYFTLDGVGYNWSKIPLIPFKYNASEMPLIKMVKSLQDGLNLIESNFQNQMEEDTRNTIMVLVNYDGENLGEFRRNLSTYGAVKVRTVDGAGGDVRTLQVEVNSENYKTIIELFKKAIIENAMAYDAKDDRLSGSPNQMNIQSMYSDIDLDANSMETEYQASLEELLWFINCHLENTGKGSFDSEQVEFIFNRDMMMNEGDIIDNITKSVGILSDETLVAQHPWVSDIGLELERIQKQKQASIDDYSFLDGLKDNLEGGDGNLKGGDG